MTQICLTIGGLFHVLIPENNGVRGGATWLGICRASWQELFVLEFSPFLARCDLIIRVVPEDTHVIHIEVCHKHVEARATRIFVVNTVLFPKLAFREKLEPQIHKIILDKCLCTKRTIGESHIKLSPQKTA